ncbi:phosphoglycolate phosphatase [Sulfurimonas sp.]|uniref:phosphoglycolate phosphatase n=1 Tax=Sulfurimonas sp. TaxID=2022749 RepID=UPI002632AAEC|nr:phosphoglycolate phosphatase [Sulfurimonas sp.]
MNIYNKKVIIFDFDGTLIDSVPDLTLAVNHMLRALSRDPFSQELVHSWVGNGAQTLVKRALLGKSEVDEILDETLFQKALDIFLNYYGKNVCIHTKLYPNVIKTLISLKDRGFKLAIVTNKPVAFVEPILQGLALDEYFEYYIGGDSLQQKKPDPEPLLHVCKKMDISVSNAVMIGDSKNDIIAASNAAMDSIGVSYGYNYGQKIDIYEPNAVVDDIYEIVEILGYAKK